MAWNRLIALVLTTLVLGACSSRVVLRSDPPEAMVWLPDEQAGNNRPLGRTPLDLAANQITKTLASNSRLSDFFELIITKEGYQTEHYFLPVESLSSSEIGLNVKLMPDHGQERLARAMLERFFNTQKMASTGDFKAAHQTIDRVLKLWPMFPRALMMKASIFYVQKDFEQSLKWYERALLTASGNDEAARMIIELRTRLGRAPIVRLKTPEERAGVVPVGKGGPALVLPEAPGSVPVAPYDESSTDSIAPPFAAANTAPPVETPAPAGPAKLQIAPGAMSELLDEEDLPEAKNSKLPEMKGLNKGGKGTTP